MRIKRKLILFLAFLVLFANINILNAEENNRKVIDIVYYGTSSCISCKEFESFLDEKIYPKYREKINLIYKDTILNSDEFQSITYSYGKEAVTPTIIINGNMYQGLDEIYENLEGEILSNKSNNFTPLNTTSIDDVYNDKFSNITLPVIIFGALLDGVNPCSIAMLLFFISILMAIGDKKKILWAGISYISAIFITYFSIGFGLLKFMTIFKGIDKFILVVYFLTIVICTILLIVDLKDYINIKNGNVAKVKNQLSKGIKHKIHNLLRKNTNSKYIYISVFIAGVLVSFLEFSCTGQVYIPTLTFILSHGNIMALLYLLLYNIVFIIPIIIVFVISYKANDIMKTSNLLLNNRAKVKILSVIFYIIIIFLFAYRIFLIYF